MPSHSKIFYLLQVLSLAKNINLSSSILYGLQGDKTCLWGFANNKGADQPAHACSLISAFVICLLETIISKLAPSEISLL